MLKTRGRPKKRDAKRNEFKLRLGEREEEMLFNLSANNELTKSEVVRKAIEFYYLYGQN